MKIMRYRGNSFPEYPERHHSLTYRNRPQFTVNHGSPTTNNSNFSANTRSSTDVNYNNLYQVLKSKYIGIYIHISSKFAPNITAKLLLQPYADVLQLKRRNTITSNFVFRPGELHIAFVFQYTIRKYTESSGLDQELIDCHIGPVALNRTFTGKPMKRVMEGYKILCFA